MGTGSSHLLNRALISGIDHMSSLATLWIEEYSSDEQTRDAAYRLLDALDGFAMRLKDGGYID